MAFSRPTRWLVAVWLVVLGIYAAVSLWLPAGQSRTAFADVFQCLLPLLANAGLLVNAVSPNWRRNAFWMLLALGCTLWMLGQFQWTYLEVYRHSEVPNPFIGDIVFFLHTVPMIAALAMRPHAVRSQRSLRLAYLDFLLLLVWWLYLYLFVVIPWQYVSPNSGLYDQNYNIIYSLENLVFVAGVALLWMTSQGRWRRIYAHLAGAGAMYMLASLVINLAISSREYASGSLYDLPLIASFLWLGTVGIIAFHSRAQEDSAAASIEEESEARRSYESWPSRLAMAAVLSLPLLGLWCAFAQGAHDDVRQFRIEITLGAILPLGFLVFLRQELVDSDQALLLRASQDSIANLQRLQTQFVQSEKLASLGQLAAGAAHEINNPLTAILGYSDLLVDDPSIPEKPRSIAEKIREQARRTKTLVTNLLSFARQMPAEHRSLLDVNTIVTSAVQLRRLDLRDKNIQIELYTESILPGVRGDPNQLLQVFFNIISNAVDAMEEVGGGTLTVRTLRERANVVILFSDTGPGIREPELVFDPFYTTKPVGKGTGLGLSICYGLVQEHNGQITCANRAEGGAIFRIELPAIPALFPTRELSPAGRAITKTGVY